MNSQVTGVEFRPELVELCNKIAKNTRLEHLQFEQGTIEKYDSLGTDILIALHACDTATDDAIYKGIKSNAGLIVVAPCCHKQIRRQLEAGKTSNELDFLTKYGIFLERQAEMVTDGIRALILEYFGYKTKVFEFISDAHTPKNVMIVGIKKQNSTLKDEQILQKIKDTKLYFGIEYHHLEKMPWVDAFLNVAMILSGMGPIGTLQTDAGKIFAGCYALFSGLALVAALGIIFAPVVHRFLHKFHLEDTGD